MDQSYQKYLAAGLVIILLISLSWYFSWIVTYLVVSSVLSLILKPLKKQLGRLHIGPLRLPDWVNSLICITIFYGLLVTFVSSFVPLVLQEAYALSKVDTNKVIQNFEEPLKYLEDLLSEFRISSNPSQLLLGYLNEKVDQILNIGNLQSVFSYFVGFTGNFFVTLFSITFITFFFVKDDKLPKQIILGAVPEQYTRRVHRILVQAERLLTRYFIGLIFQISGITLVAYIGLTIIGIKNALLIGFFAGVINIIPYLGPIIGALFGTFVAISTNLEMQTANELLSVVFQVFLVFGGVQVTDNMLFQPLIFSSSVKAHPLEVFLIVLVGGRLGGILGMVAAIPTYTFIRIVAKEFLNEFEVVKRLTYKL